jgi:hypothetical protein
MKQRLGRLTLSNAALNKKALLIEKRLREAEEALGGKKKHK